MIRDSVIRRISMSASVAPAIAKRPRKKNGLALWMERVLEECVRASLDFSADPVHDLRVALRRCRSVADGLRVMDPGSRMETDEEGGPPALRELGELRDVQVMEGWVRHLGDPADPVAITLLQFLSARESPL